MSNTSKKTVSRTTAPARRVRPSSAPEQVVSVSADISEDEVAALAYRYFVEGGYQHGHALEHWLRAEGHLRGR
jgi:DUF2934 family protein